MTASTEWDSIAVSSILESIRSFLRFALYEYTRHIQ